MIIDKKEFCLYVEKLNISNDNGMVQNILDACEEFSIDPEMVEPLVNTSINEKIKEDFIDMNYIKRENTAII